MKLGKLSNLPATSDTEGPPTSVDRHSLSTAHPRLVSSILQMRKLRTLGDKELTIKWQSKMPWRLML